jgi:hypothetical protein
MNGKKRTNGEQRHSFLLIAHCSLLFAALLFAALLWSCDYGNLGNADRTVTYYAGDPVFTERMDFMCGHWYSHSPGIGRLDGYRIRKWSDFTSADKTKAQTLFSAADFNADNPVTYSTKDIPKNTDYVLLFDDTAYGQQDDDSSSTGESWGFSCMGLVRAINIFNNNKDRGSIIIEYFEGAYPTWLYTEQGLEPGEKPFYGIYYKVLDQDTVQMANPVDLAEMYANNFYYTEKGTLQEAIETFGVENEAEFISWGVVIPQDRE